MKKKAGSILLWLCLWQLLSREVNNKILLVGPLETLGCLLENAVQLSFWRTVLLSMGKIAAGFGLGSLVGICLALVSGKWSVWEDIWYPPMAFLKAAPVASFVVLFLIWWDSEFLSVAVTFCVVLPNLYVNTLEGIKSTDRELLEMAEVFSMPFRNRFFYIYRPALSPFLTGSIQVAAGMSWKSGVAAEVIGTPKFSVGEQIYMAKVYLDTASVFAWTLAVIVLSILFERFLMYLWRLFLQWNPTCKRSRRQKETGRTGTGAAVSLQEISKSYGEQQVLQKVTEDYEAGNTYLFNTPSGSGKTTLFRLVAGLEVPDSGRLIRNYNSLTYIFQENRLCEDYSAVKNLELVCGDREQAEGHLLRLLEKEDLEKPCRELSGGQKRRVAIARAFCVESDVVLADEPFTGLDQGNREAVRQYMEEESRKRLLMIASHI